MRTGPGNRSSLVSHTFPSFYACYLLKSVQTTNSKANYIGSTPNPPRRIRQHNGELTQGAWKTSRGRPWVMQIIVHGFPSRLAALGFEWAWQHPNVSRHLRDENGKVFSSTGRTLKQNIQILRFMVSVHPYNLWPLHVKIFTPQALKIWEELGTSAKKTIKGKGKEKATAIQSTVLPTGFTYTVELEGVDGKGAGGSGRKKPIQVQDEEEFTTKHLNKHLDILASKALVHCSVCREPLVNYVSEPLTNALCPHSSCSATAHLLCLSNLFLAQLGGSDAPLVPRGGSCPSCANYVLWGDVVKGCYRRAAGGAVTVEEDEEALDGMYTSDSLAQDDTGSDVEGSIGKGKAKEKGKAKVKRTISPRKKRELGRVESGSSSQGEQFDFHKVEEEQYSYDPDSRTRTSPYKLKIGKTQVTLPTPVTPRARKSKSASRSPSEATPKKRARTKKEKVLGYESSESEGERFDFDAVERGSEDDDEGVPGVPKRKVGRPRKIPGLDEAGPSSALPKRKVGRPRKMPGPDDEAGPSAVSPKSAVKRGRPRKDVSRSSPKSHMKVSGSPSKRTFMGGAGGRAPNEVVPFEPPEAVTLPLFASDDDDTGVETEDLDRDDLVRSMSSLSVTSWSSR
ncbi:hypothetical protein BDP27DRAFT_573136 [Rhodocollybia butyracea]|uniref:GIY-YIG domain-containing protein n=1 Tax=Rhodocollybia butyracea TaxID=206335 RepID=A0A9P5PX62_9AGAR|nr:hypothetical protein BDP27DRAFT_573136 [Rhodocollybia butyracea]